MTRYIAWLLILAAGLPAWAAEPQVSEDPAVAAVEALGGKITRNDKLPGRPIVHVNLVGTSFSDADLKNFRGLPHLHTLFVGRTQITDAGVQGLKELPALETLCLGSPAVTAAGLRELKEVKGLKSLCLGSLRVSGAMLKEVKALAGLQKLVLTGIKTNDALLTYLRQALPGIKITAGQDAQADGEAD
jgi:internalin A